FATEMIPYISSLVILAALPWLAPIVFLLLIGWWLRSIPGQFLGLEQWRQLKKLVHYEGEGP
ncbi:MAG TPA: hypothetical protein VE082_01055, partial [Desulfobaccales bacterium]|nr:hypothetical protein [Desulfobaccales bacterium]